ncbi:hypothetical protein HPB48_026434 [Haemaphysalis longicornis]|uniref:Uncharacterized protein n=1 Tax=Haemaphysalis longicornis TaxID=44386 RepID=A0A9J6H9R3_HAELO|nr:hypothetical protein HPB48_026434 [Haemaphysalis longicornis]
MTRVNPSAYGLPQGQLESSMTASRTILGNSSLKSVEDVLPQPSSGPMLLLPLQEQKPEMSLSSANHLASNCQADPDAKSVERILQVNMPTYYEFPMACRFGYRPLHFPTFISSRESWLVPLPGLEKKNCNTSTHPLEKLLGGFSEEDDPTSIL